MEVYHYKAYVPPTVCLGRFFLSRLIDVDEEVLRFGGQSPGLGCDEIQARNTSSDKA